MPHESFMPRVRDICDRYGVLLIADEVITAFGRSGAWTGSRLWGVQPDMMCVAKGITNGFFPFGAAMISKKVADAFESNRDGFGAIGHGYTYSAHPVGAAAALATLREIEVANVADNAAVRGEELLRGCRALMDKHELVGDVRGKGLMIGLELVADRDSKQPADKEVPQTVLEVAYVNGVMLRVSGNLVILSPPLVITNEQVNVILAALDAGLTAAK